MDINRHNYEAFLLDLLEGRLSAEEEDKLNEFLKNHPELVADMPDLTICCLEKDEVSFPGREQLRKDFPMAGTPLSEANFDLFSIARMEGDLSLLQEEEHQAMVDREPVKLAEWNAWQKTRLVPGQIQFPGKKHLKRRKIARTRVLWAGVISAAASLMLLWVLLRMNPQHPGPGLSEVVSVETPSLDESPASITENAVVEAEEAPVARVEEPSLAGVKEALRVPEKEAPVRRVEQPLLAAIETKPSGADLREAEIAGEVNMQLLKPRPVKMTAQMAVHSDLLGMHHSDRIEPLKVAPVSPNLSSLSVIQMAEMDRQELFEEIREEYNISLMSLANAGIKGINKVTGSEISLLASRDEEGEVSGFRLRSKRFSVSSPLGGQE
jgi:hypothetical protein